MACPAVAATATAVTSHRPAWVRGLQWAWIAIVLVFVGYYAFTQWDTFATHDWTISFGWLGLAILLSVIRRYLGALRWIEVISLGERRDPGSRKEHMRVYFLSNLANYVPGSVFFLATRIQMSRTAGLSTLRASAALTYDTGMLVLSGLGVGAMALALASGFNAGQAMWLGASALALSYLPFHPWLTSRIVLTVQRLRSKPAAPFSIRFVDAFRLWNYTVLLWVCGGGALFFTIKSFSPALPFGQLVDVVSAAAAGWTGGFLALWAPAGLGVREGLLGWMLTALAPAHVLAVSLVGARLLTVFEDVFWAALVARSGKPAPSEIGTDR